MKRLLRYLGRLAPLFAAAAMMSSTSYADDAVLPPRAEWHASTSSEETPAMAAAFAIDGNDSTRWGGAFSPEQWLQVDLGRAVVIGGALIRWGDGSVAYRIQSSLDGRQWQTALETTDTQGGIEYVFFPAVAARYLRLAGAPSISDWVSVFEFEPLSTRDSPRIIGLGPGSDAAALWNPGPPRALRATSGGARTLTIRFPRALPIAGLEVYWGAARSGARLEARGDSQGWQTLADDPDSRGDMSYLAAREPHSVSELRLEVRAAGEATPAIRRLQLLGPARVMTPLKRYEIAATRAQPELHPPSLRDQQTYWTVVGVPAGRRKSIFDEYGDVEAFKGAPVVQPLWRGASEHAAAAFDKAPTHSLREGWIPMPAVEWSPEPGLQLRSEAMTVERAGAPVTLVRHSLRNTSTERIEGMLELLVRPLQINPVWQHGGASPIRTATIEGTAAQARVRINGQVLLYSLAPVDVHGASAFGVSGEGEITHRLAEGSGWNPLAAHDDDGLAAAFLGYRVQLEPGARRDVVIAFPLGDEREQPADAFDTAMDFDALAAQLARQWQSRLAGVDLSLPDDSLVEALRAQVAYMLINQAGPAMQPGPRNYNRSFIRDGSATAAVLLRMGMARTARDYLHWYAEHAVHANGLVSPILNEDGTVNRGFGSDIEYDSQGEFVWLVAEVARLDGGADSVREYQPTVQRALQFLQALRERTLIPGYRAEQPAAERFHGILAPSISHEGYSTPTHSYWDDYWALKGWQDGAWLADAWGDQALAAWARAQYALLHESMAASIHATMIWRGSDVVPTDADSGNGDPTSVSIALDPCNQQDLLPADALARTFERYLQEVRKRQTPGSIYAYTPYEMRNVLTYVHLDRPQDADELLRTLLKDRRPATWQVLAEVVHSRLRHPRYLGDMPHTWVGAEYVRAIFGMLMHEDDRRLQLLPGAPPSWLERDGLRVGRLPTAFGTLSMSARQRGSTLQVILQPGLREDTALQIRWPSRIRPSRVTVDGKAQQLFTAEGIDLQGPFRQLIAEWL